MKVVPYIAVLLLTACSSVSPSLRKAPESDLNLHTVLADSASYQGQAVLWGGKVIEVRNHESYSEIQLVQFPLNNRSRPIDGTDSQGRFIVRSNQFLDPKIYQTDLMVTVSGVVQGATTVQVDQKSLTLPIITLNQAHVWPKNNAAGVPYNPKHDWPFVGIGYYGTGSYSP